MHNIINTVLKIILGISRRALLHRCPYGSCRETKCNAKSFSWTIFTCNSTSVFEVVCWKLEFVMLIFSDGRMEHPGDRVPCPKSIRDSIEKRAPLLLPEGFEDSSRYKSSTKYLHLLEIPTARRQNLRSRFLFFMISLGFAQIRVLESIFFRFLIVFLKLIKIFHF